MPTTKAPARSLPVTRRSIAARDERRRDEIEARQDHAPEQQRHERDDGQRDATVGNAGPEPAETGGEEEHADRPGERHLRGEDDAEGGRGSR